MNKIYRTLKLLLIISLFFFLLSACKDDSGSSSSSDDSSTPGYTYSVEKILRASDSQAGDRLGNLTKNKSIAISGDTLIVGASGEDGGAGDPVANSGAVYVFVRSGTDWSEQAILRASDSQANDGFGTSVDIDGDTIIVGAMWEDGGAADPTTDAGTAYIFTRSGSTWTEQAILRASDAETEDYFGESVAIHGGTVIIGATTEDGGAGSPVDKAGAAYIFTGSGNTWTEQAILRASNKGDNDQFGESVDINGDTAVVGAMLEDGAAVDAGAAYVFTRSGTTWIEQKILRASDAEIGDRFGRSAAIDGDTILIGAMSENGAAGAAYVYTGSGSTWTEQAILRASDGQGGDNFADTVSVSGDTAVVGARLEDGGAGDPAADAGAAYIFKRSGTTWTEQSILRASDAQAGDSFGSAVGIVAGTIVIAAPNEDGGAGDPLNLAGVVYVYQ